jgi:hypothetical protein
VERDGIEPSVFMFDLTTTKLIQQPKKYKDSGFLLYLSHDYFQVHLGRTQQQVQPVLVEELKWRSEVVLVEELSVRRSRQH